ncbi:MAG: phosphoglycerate kinase [Coriobacteriaceae bacterium]|jgi:phosphoglycerate kinase|nr:phosphoglycerate kinase [Coriobacteriaceae bacterium]
MPGIRGIAQADLAGKRVLTRVDFNVPLKGGEVGDDTRIRAALPTVRHILEQGGLPVLMSHLGRPAGTGFEEAFSLAPVARHLARLLDAEVLMAGDVTGPDAQEKARSQAAGQVLLLENLRFDPREKKNDPGFCAQLAAFGDVYVNDAFGTAHRAHASTTGVAALLPAYAGFLLASEVDTLSGMLEAPERPFVAILGGSKVSDKIKVIEALLGVCDTLVIGGGMCFTFLLAQGMEVGASLKEEDWVERCKQTLAHAKERGTEILLPLDIVAADAFAEDANTLLVPADSIPADMMGLDIGPATASRYSKAVQAAATVFWNGPMGVFEMEAFAAGTREVALAMAGNTQAKTIIGGGDSVAAVNRFGLADKMTFISTGGGASMEMLQGKPLPGVLPLREASDEA